MQLRKHKATRKPASPKGINLGSSFAKNLEFLFVGKNYPDLVSGKYPASGSATTVISNFDEFGSGLSTNFNGTSDDRTFPEDLGHQTLGSSTLFALVKYDTFPSSYTAFVSISGVGETEATNYVDFIGHTNAKRLRAFWEFSTGGNVLTDSDVLSINAGEWHLYTITRTVAATSSVRFYLDGVQQGSTVTGLANPSGGTSSVARVGVDQGGAARFDGEIALLGKASRAWTDEEIKNLHKNVWQMFDQNTYIPGESGGAPSLSTFQPAWAMNSNVVI